MDIEFKRIQNKADLILFELLSLIFSKGKPRNTTIRIALFRPVFKPGISKITSQSLLLEIVVQWRPLVRQIGTHIYEWTATCILGTKELWSLPNHVSNYTASTLQKNLIFSSTSVTMSRLRINPKLSAKPLIK